MSGGITTHVLDVSLGAPARGVAVLLDHWEEEGNWRPVGQGVTDADGRARDLVGPDHIMSAGRYRLSFATDTYFEGRGVRGFYPEVVVVFEIRDPAEHFHLPLLLSPFGYSTYRGS